MVDVFKLALRRLGLEGCEFKGSLGNLMRPLWGKGGREGKEGRREGQKEGREEKSGKRREGEGNAGEEKVALARPFIYV